MGVGRGSPLSQPRAACWAALFRSHVTRTYPPCGPRGEAAHHQSGSGRRTGLRRGCAAAPDRLLSRWQAAGSRGRAGDDGEAHQGRRDISRELPQSGEINTSTRPEKSSAQPLTWQPTIALREVQSPGTRCRQRVFQADCRKRSRRRYWSAEDPSRSMNGHAMARARGTQSKLFVAALC